ncbi:MAG: D-alanyl-D-alanine carboxypeptidase family protein [Minisyncoccia bacterium]
MLEIIAFLEFLKSIAQPANILNFNLKNENQEIILNYRKIENLNIDKNLISAKSVLIKEIDGDEIFGKNSEEIRPIASLTKLLTAIISFENYKDNDTFIINKEILKYNGESGGFVEGEKFFRDELIKILLTASSNKAGYALAYKIGVENFVNKMNERAKEIGLKNSYFVDPVGLDKNNRSNLNDLYELSEYILKNYPEIFKYSILPYVDIKKSYYRRVYNLNYLLPYYKDYILGSKTGSTDDAKECLLLILKFKKSPIIFLGLLGSEDRFKDAEYLLSKLKKYYGE